MHTQKVYFLNKQKEKLSAIIHQPSKKTNKLAIICHGFASNKNALWIPKLCNTLAKKGITALRFDFSGNGQSEGKFENSNCEKEKQDLHAIITKLSKKYTKITTIGHSMGGTIILMNSSQEPAVKAAIAIAPAIHTNKVEKKLLTIKEKKELHKKGKIRIHIQNQHYTLTKQFFTAFEKQKVLKNIKKTKAKLLIIHGSEDHTIPLEESQTAKKQAPQLKLTIIEGGNHTLMKGKSANILIQTITQWLKQNF